MSMKLVQVECLFDGSKAVFYFCAEGRVDFRELVRDLAQALHTRIEMKQIGARDETKLIGGVGPCGRELCCSTWLREFQAVSVQDGEGAGPVAEPVEARRACAAGSSAACATSTRPTSSCGARCRSVGATVDVASRATASSCARTCSSRPSIVRRDEDGVEVEATLEDLVEKRAD